MPETLVIPDFPAYTLGIVVYFIGVKLNRRFRLLREFNIPEPVTGGLVATVFTFICFAVFDTQIAFELETRDRLLVYFFTAIGLNARIVDLVAGGKPLLVLLVLTLSYIVVQNIVGMGAASALGMSSKIGVLAGSTSLIGGHGTAIAWAPDFAEAGIAGAMEIGIAAATLGLVVASLIGGPVAKYLIRKYSLKSDAGDEVVGVAYDEQETKSLSHENFMAVILAIHCAIIVGFFVNQFLVDLGFKLPLFVTCLLTAIVFSNTIPRIFPTITWPARTPALAVVSDFALGLFLALSLMSMQLWTIASLAGPLLVILAAQTLAAVLFIVFILFPLMGKNYQAAVLSAGFGGFALGATPTAIANMTAVTKANGPAPLAFIILPLVAAFFVDVTNAFVIKAALGL